VPSFIQSRVHCRRRRKLEKFNFSLQDTFLAFSALYYLFSLHPLYILCPRAADRLFHSTEYPLSLEQSLHSINYYTIQSEWNDPQQSNGWMHSSCFRFSAPSPLFYARLIWPIPIGKTQNRPERWKVMD
jgi:hypothetical protein